MRGVCGDEKPSVLRSRRTRRRRRRMKKFLRAHRPRNQSKMVQEILADLKKNPCFVDDDDDTGEKGRVRI